VRQVDQSEKEEEEKERGAREVVGTKKAPRRESPENRPEKGAAGKPGSKEGEKEKLPPVGGIELRGREKKEKEVAWGPGRGIGERRK